MITFLPWLRRGLAQALENEDPLSGALARGATIRASVEVEDERAEQTLRLIGPEAVTGLSAGQILREEPRDGSTDAEPNYFAFAELAAADLPWMFTPARADAAQDRLRPWLVLIVVREQEGVTLSDPGGGELPVLTIAPPAVAADELPDLAESWAWAHVHSLAEDVAAAVDGQDVFARLLSPRRLLPREGWLACVVGAFVAGETTLEPAWTTPPAGRVDLPVYHHWRFETGASGDFEALCRRLQPDGDGAELGLHAMDVTAPGVIEPAPKRAIVDMRGALHTLEAVPRAWDGTHFERELGPLLNAGAAPYDKTKDPVVAPPLYGCRPAGENALPADGWLNELNADPVLRAAAGLGARAVRNAQEALVAAAWEQAGELRATVAALNRGRLGAEVARSLTRRARGLGDADLLQFTARLHPALGVRAQLDASPVPRGLVTTTHLRQTRPGTTLARDWGRASRLVADHVQVTLDATAATPRPAVVGALEFARAPVPAGAWLDDPTLRLDSAARAARARRMRTARPADFAAAAARIAVPARRRRPARTPAAAPLAVPPPTVDVSAIADVVRDTLNPFAAVRDHVLARIPQLELAANELPTTVAVGPVFTDALYWDLVDMGPDWVLPGLKSLARNRVRLVEGDARFVGAFLIGANHQLGQELLWRGYPVDLRATFFHRFWSYVDPLKTDIPDLTTFKPRKSLTANMIASATALTVIVVRGDIVRRHPTAHYYLQREEGGDPVDGTELEPDVLGTLGRDATFFGFSGLEPETVRDGYFFVIEEQAGAPRFGFDEVKAPQFEKQPKTWNDAAWGHLVTSWEEYDALTHARADNARLTSLGNLNGTTWGLNSAHVARVSWQRPFRMFMHASTLV